MVNLQKEIFDTLILLGEKPDIINNEHYIISRGIKYSKRRINNKDYYYVEDTYTRPNYYTIENIMILQSILKALKNDNR